jgi:hypothetical protein
MQKKLRCMVKKRPSFAETRRVVFSIGHKRFAFDISTTVTELLASPGEVLQIDKHFKKKLGTSSQFSPGTDI